MRPGEQISVARVASQCKNAEHDGHADDIDEERAQTVSSATSDQRTFVSNRKRRYKLFLSVLQKVNMCFLVLFMAYFVWTISANHAEEYSGIEGSSWNHSHLINSTNEVIIN